MPALLDLVPATKITDPDWEQPLESVVDVSGYTEAALMMYLINMVCGTEGTTTINIQTAIENRDEQYVTIASTSYTSAPSMPTNVYIYLKGSTSGSSTAPGFARHLRVTVTQTGGGSPYITLCMKALLK